MKVLVLLLLVVIFAISQTDAAVRSGDDDEEVIKHPFTHVGNYEVANETVIKYFYSGDIHASWQKAVELCEIFEMQLTIFKDEKEEKNFREKFAKFFNGRDSFIFLGANTTTGGTKNNWQWMNGEKIKFDMQWGEGQPNNDENKEFCLCFDESDPLLYHDISCTEEYPFVCQEIWNYERILVKKTKTTQ